MRGCYLFIIWLFVFVWGGFGNDKGTGHVNACMHYSNYTAYIITHIHAAPHHTLKKEQTNNTHTHSYHPVLRVGSDGGGRVYRGGAQRHGAGVTEGRCTGTSFPPPPPPAKKKSTTLPCTASCWALNLFAHGTFPHPMAYIAIQPNLQQQHQHADADVQQNRRRVGQGDGHE